MTTEQQNLAWACLPKEMREEIKRLFNKANTLDNFSAMGVFIKIFGSHNLTSDTEPEEMLMVERKKVQKKWQRAYEQESNYAKAQDSPTTREEMYYCRGIMSIIDSLFGDKCLPDKENTPKSGELKSDKATCKENLQVEQPSDQVEPKFKVGDKVKICINSYGKIYDGIIKTIKSVRLNNDNVFVYSFFDYDLELDEHHLELYTEPKTKDNMEEKETLKEKYWKNGNIFEMSTGKKRLVWENQLMDSYGFIPKIFFNENLVNMDSTIGEKVIRVYSPNTKAGYFKELIETKEENLLWEKSKFIFTEKEIKEKLGISEEKELIIIK